MYGSSGLVRDRREMQRRLQMQRMQESQMSKQAPQEQPNKSFQATSPAGASPWSFSYLTMMSGYNKRPNSNNDNSSVNHDSPRPALE
mmetsp:Transcript_2745/g.5564  ORF Transcript_2745/g.5564 Transcript_2745/m.5564 type:complete len:87 (-) Transcript_2745:278-538(-)|eukprot:CAMPEP_0172441214 /NCGR_PEP_ID=MMETSP1065-20121228/1788_1 /TAXON_ID=265537 /ORGANISM="Amphiprora paludosa, Strain CCMP125" /LENGTH=86 /DNA_ID=CAMNT_0013190463 /DNA_START=98 /DNA_END=358 /DNA_ORIENTATION=+